MTSILNGEDIIAKNHDRFYKIVPYTDRWKTYYSTHVVAGSGSGLIWDGHRKVYYTPSNVFQDLSVLDLDTGLWTTANATPTSLSANGLVWTGSNLLYLTKGFGTNTFWSWDRSKSNPNRFTVLATGPKAGNNAQAVLCPGNDGFIYCIPADLTRDLYRYDIGADSWASRASMPTGAGVASAGTSMVHVAATGLIYTTRGNNTTDFYAYNPVTNSWGSALAAVPWTISEGATLMSDGGNYIYAVRGINGTNMSRYDISANGWTAMTARPWTTASLGAQSSVYVKPGMIISLRGQNLNTVARYFV